MPLPQAAEQSGSVAAEHPIAQHPSCGPLVVMGACLQAAEQSLAAPVMLSTVHGSPSLQEAGQAPVCPVAIAGSQLSPGSSRPLPQVAAASPPEPPEPPLPPTPAEPSELASLVLHPEASKHVTMVKRMALLRHMRESYEPARQSLPAA
jgi:hypothetical protein